MTKVLDSRRRFVFLGPQKGLLPDPIPPRVSICHDRSELETLVSGSRDCATWVSFNRSSTDMLLQRLLDLRVDLRGSRLVTLKPPRAESIAALLGLFDSPVFGLIEGFHWLPSDELIAALMRDDASDRFIGGSVDPKAKALTLLRGNLKTVVVPFSAFPASGDGTRPDFTRLAFTDYGSTVKLGDYEAAADAILYEQDPDYRRRLNHQRRQTDRSFGASLMRLRTQRRLRRVDFSPISAKEIARIERNEVGNPHSRTIQVISDRLGVRPEDIESY
jgi:hypothetical protein